MLLKVMLRLVIYAAVVLAITKFVPGISVSSYSTALLVAFVWGLISVTLKPILALLTLPINFLSLGLFSFVLNAFLFWLVGVMVPGFDVVGFLPALEGSVILTLVGWGLHTVL